jgi:hypothetical protein
MPDVINLYCDESCHLENDHQPVMVLGALTCPIDHARAVALAVRALKREHGLADGFEIKWTKVSPAKTAFYRAVIGLFFADEKLAFRGLVVPNKEALRHAEFAQTHDDWYYKMYYLLLRPVLRQPGVFRAFLDIKDTKGGLKVRRLHEYLCAHLHDPEAKKLQPIQLVHSDEIACLQLADLLIGALGYVHRELTANAGKIALIEDIRAQSGLTLKYSTAPGRRKFDVFVWEANAGDMDE